MIDSRGYMRYIAIFIFCFLMIISQALIAKRESDSKKTVGPDLEKLIMYKSPQWEMISSSIDDPIWKKSSEYQYDKVSAKTYQSKDGEKITIVITWSRNGIQMAGHEQQWCYSAQGFSIEQQKYINVNIHSKKFRLTNFEAKNINGLVEDVYYWRITNGNLLNDIHESILTDYRLSHRILKFEEMIGYLFDKVPENIMVRVSAYRMETEKPSNVQQQFIKEYLESLSPADRRLLTGI